jgi:CheY-like chemotaxis protein
MGPKLPTTTPSPNPNGKKVLCIEDEHFISELYIRALSKAGYQVTVEVDGAKGLTLAQSDQFDIILLDLMIPTITGTEVLKKLRNPDLAPHLHAKIIITTNLEQREDIRADIERQADGYIIKAAVTPKELVDILSRIKL